MRQNLIRVSLMSASLALMGCDLIGVKPLVLYVDTGGPATTDSQPPEDSDGLTVDSADTGGETGDALVDGDEDGYASAESGGDDCDDTDEDINPGADEICDGVDNDCDALIDDEDDDLDLVTATVWFVDADQDGYGDSERSVAACVAPDGSVDNADDCDDTDAAYNPEALEDDCTDPNDYNCDGSVGYEDADGDGWAACEDCDDDPATGADINPGAVEICDDADADEDCDGLADDLDPEGADGATLWYTDADSDTFGDPDASVEACDQPAGAVADGTDCDDDPATGADVYPGGVEVCDPLDADEDCDGLADDLDPEGADGATTWYLDDDSDGYGDPTNAVDACEAPSGYDDDDLDCDDTTGAVSPAAAESAGDGVDQDCDGTELCFADDDDDGYRPDAGTTTVSLDTDCDDAFEAVSADPIGDCDDGDGGINPGADELCDAADRDEDCDGSADDADPEGALGGTTWYLDGDGDGFGDGADAGADFCDVPGGGYSLSSDDCDDGDFAIKPTAAEVCDDFDVDEDCDGAPDDADPEGASGQTVWYPDDDGDGFGDQLDPGLTTCEDLSGLGYIDNFDDCDDLLGAVNPNATEVCDELDNDCDGVIDYALFETDFEAGLPAGMTVNGDAVVVDDGGDLKLQLTDGVTSSQSATAFLDTLFPADEFLYASFTVDIRTTIGGAADGMAFALLDSDNPCLLSGAGGSLGLTGLPGYTFELDLYDGGVGADGDLGLVPGGAGTFPHCGFMEVVSQGDPFSLLDYEDGVCSSGFLDAGEVFVEIYFQNGLYDLLLDGVPVLSGDNSADYLLTDDLLLGFGGATGGALSQILVDDIYIQCAETDAVGFSTCDCVDGQDLGGALGSALVSETSEGGGDSSAAEAGGDCTAGLGADIDDVAHLWTAPAAGTYTFDTAGSSFDTVLYLLDGCDGAQLECDDQSGGGGTSSITRAMSAGEQVVIVVDGWNGAGTYVLNITN